MGRRSVRHSAITFVIFDMDGVLAHLDRDKRLEWLSRTTGKIPEHFNATVWHSDFERSAEAGEYQPLRRIWLNSITGLAVP